jgi:hypothetical protein
MKKILLVVFVMMIFDCWGCGETKWNSKLQNAYTLEGKKAGYSQSVSCLKEAMKKTNRNYYLQFCGTDPKCRELAEQCLKDKGFILPEFPD